MSPVFIEIDDEPLDELIAFTPEELRPKMIKKGDPEFESVGERLLRRAMEDTTRCPHNWGFSHFWRNPKMLPPCQVTKIDGTWYRRKDCSYIDLDNLESR
jgi:hypothetical protein